jgi:hypothetical protein
MRVQTVIAEDDFEILTDFCIENRVSVSSLLNALVTDFLECTDKKRVASVVEEARKVKSGRPRNRW